MKYSSLALVSSFVLGHRKCGNEVVPSPEENARIMAEISNYSTSQGLSETVIPVHFHVITSADGNMGDLSDSTVAEQVEVMNNAFGPAGFSFKTVDINRVKNDQWFNNLDGSVWKEAAKALKQGGAGTLNIYSANLPEGILGIAQFPWEAWWRRKTDGVRCASGSFPKGNIRDFNLGMTCVHEVGHWMGLYHTFQGGCRRGDWISDTPAIAAPTSGCPKSADTCPGDTFLDDVKNYMDYSDDACMDHFTPGQNALMNKMWNRYRAREYSNPTITTTVLPATSTPTSGTELGTIIFNATKLKPTVTGRLIQGVEVRISYDIGRMGFGCPTLRYCYRFGWFSPKVCETVPANEAGSIPITFDNYGTAYLSFENVDGENVCALDWPGFRGYSVTVDSQ